MFLAWRLEFGRQTPFRFKSIGCLVHDSLAPECDEFFAYFFRTLQRATNVGLFNQFLPTLLGELRLRELLCRSNMIPFDKCSYP